MSSQLLQSTSIAVIGAGSVGATAAYACMLKRVSAQVLLVDVNRELVEAQVLDLQDSTFTNESTVIRVGTPAEAGQCHLIVITAGVKQRPGETRADLVGRNHAILQSIFASMRPIRSDAILLVVANPCDVLTRIAQELSGLPLGQVFGSGTFLDSERLCARLAPSFGVSPTSINAYVLGEHGDSQFVAWSLANIGNTPLARFPEYASLDRERIAANTKNKAYSIIAAKGATHFGIGAVVASLAETILFDTRQVRPVSHYIPELQCCLSLPAILGREGVCRTIPCMELLDAAEQQRLRDSAATIRDILASTSAAAPGAPQ